MDQLPNNIEKNIPNLSDAIDQIMSHPEWISMVASALGKAPSDRESADPPKQEEIQTSVSDDAAASIPPVLSRLSQIKSPLPKGKNTRADLLCALKPYLSPGRQEAIDYMIRISQISDLIKHMT